MMLKLSIKGVQKSTNFINFENIAKDVYKMVK